MKNQVDVGTESTGFVTAKDLPGPRECRRCEHYNGGNCDGEHVMADPELAKRRNKDGTVRVESTSYCWYFEPA